MLRYDPGQDSWSVVAAMAYHDSSFGMFVLGGRMFAVGEEFTEVYDPATDTWSAGQAPRISRYGMGACTVKAEVNLFDAMIARARRG